MPARLSAEERIAKLELQLEEAKASIGKRTEKKIDQLKAKREALVERMTKLDNQVDELDAQIAELEGENAKDETTDDQAAA